MHVNFWAPERTGLWGWRRPYGWIRTVEDSGEQWIPCVHVGNEQASRGYWDQRNMGTRHWKLDYPGPGQKGRGDRESQTLHLTGYYLEAILFFFSETWKKFSSRTCIFIAAEKLHLPNSKLHSSKLIWDKWTWSSSDYYTPKTVILSLSINVQVVQCLKGKESSWLLDPVSRKRMGGLKGYSGWNRRASV